MASMIDPDVDEHFSNKLDEIRNKMLVQAVNKTTDAEMEQSQAHKQFLKSVKEKCSKKCKEDETMFETIQKYKNDLEQTHAVLKETRDAVPEILSEIEEKDIQKEVMIRNTNRLRDQQAKKKELILSQSRANKDRLKNLNKDMKVFLDHLGLEIRKIHGEKLQFIFRNLNTNDPECVYTFVLQISEEGSYQVDSCDPPMECMASLQSKLRETNNFSAFLANVRKEFASLPKV